MLSRGVFGSVLFDKEMLDPAFSETGEQVLKVE
jgi:hypothetical protein